MRSIILIVFSILFSLDAWSITRFPTDTKGYIQLTGSLKLSTKPVPKAYDVDLFDTSQEMIDQLKRSGKLVICYFSAGSYENWRSDAKLFKKSDYGKPLDGWAGENWLNINSVNVKKIMQKRMDLAQTKGCHGIDPDNVDGYTNDNGLKLTASEQLSYNKFLAIEAHKRNLAIGLKNSPDQAKALEPYFDFSVVEQCHQYNECNQYLPFKNANKAIFNMEYNSKYKQSNNFNTMCKNAKKYGMHSAVYSLSLNGSYYKSCQ